MYVCMYVYTHMYAYLCVFTINIYSNIVQQGSTTKIDQLLRNHRPNDEAPLPSWSQGDSEDAEEQIGAWEDLESTRTLPTPHRAGPLQMSPNIISNKSWWNNDYKGY